MQEAGTTSYLMVVNARGIRLLREKALGVDIHDVHILLRHVGRLVWPIPPVHQHVVERLVPPACPNFITPLLGQASAEGFCTQTPQMPGHHRGGALSKGQYSATRRGIHTQPRRWTCGKQICAAQGGSLVTWQAVHVHLRDPLGGRLPGSTAPALSGTTLH